MKAIKTEIPGVVASEVFGDARLVLWSTFLRSGGSTNWSEPVRFVLGQNESRNRAAGWSGLHFQKGEYAQAKLVSVVRGRASTSAVDIRRGSPTFGRHVAALLDGENKRQLFIPRGFAHGFAVLSDEAVFQYKCDNYYAPGSEGGIAWDDPALAIDWRLPAGEILLSEKDRRHPKLADAPELFEYDRP